MRPSDIKSLIVSEQENFDAILAKIAKNGPRDAESMTALMASSVRFNQLEVIKRTYLTSWED